MRNWIILLLVASVFTFVACEKDDEKATATINFTATYDGAPLVMFEAYDYPGVSSVRFQRLSYFISNVQLLKVNSGEAVDVTEVYYVDFQNLQDESSALAGVNLPVEDLPAGEYSGLRFTVGVSPTLNQTSPADYPTTHPLAKEYWENWASYISLKVEANADTLGNGTHDLGLQYHLADTSATADYVLELAQPISLTEDATTTIPITIDLKAIMSTENGSLVDVKAKPRDHGKVPEFSKMLMTNLKNAMEIQK